MKFIKNKKSKDICVIGAGRFGQSVITQLYKLGVLTTVIDKEEKNLNSIKEYTVAAITADAADLKALEAIGVQNIETVIVAMTDNIEIIAALLELKVKNIIARANNHRHARVLRQIGVNMIIRPEEEAGIRTALFAVNQSFIKYTNDLQELGDGYVVGSTLLTCPKYIGVLLKKANFQQMGVLVVMVKRGNDSFLPDGNLKLEKNDLITIIGKIDSVTKVFQQINTETSDIHELEKNN